MVRNRILRPLALSALVASLLGAEYALAQAPPTFNNYNSHVKVEYTNLGDPDIYELWDNPNVSHVRYWIDDDGYVGSPWVRVISSASIYNYYGRIEVWGRLKFQLQIDPQTGMPSHSGYWITSIPKGSTVYVFGAFVEVDSGSYAYSPAYPAGPAWLKLTGPTGESAERHIPKFTGPGGGGQFRQHLDDIVLPLSATNWGGNFDVTFYAESGPHPGTYDNSASTQIRGPYRIIYPNTLPTTEAVVNGTTVTLNAIPRGSRISGTYYTVDGAPTQTYAGPFAVSGGGSHDVRYWSVAGSGSEVPNALSVGVPNAPPAVTVPSSVQAESTEHGADVTVNVTASDADGDALTVRLKVGTEVVDTKTLAAGGPPSGGTVELLHRFPLGVTPAVVEVFDGTATTTANISVNVSDTTAAVISVIGSLEVTVEAGDTYNDQGAAVADAC